MKIFIQHFVQFFAASPKKNRKGRLLLVAGSYSTFCFFIFPMKISIGNFPLKFQNRCNFFSSGAIGSILRSFDSTDKNDQASVVERWFSRNRNFQLLEVQKFRKKSKKTWCQKTYFRAVLFARSFSNDVLNSAGL